MTDNAKQLTTFVAVSSLLTGIAADKLAPQLDPNDIKRVYFDYLMAQAPQQLTRLLELYASEKAAGKSDPQIAAAIFAADVAWFARSVILMWYLGSWYTPDSLSAYARQANAAPTVTDGCPSVPFPPGGTVVSSLAYTQGWAWNVAQAHAMGHSNFRFGYWANNPPSLADFVGGGQ